MAANFALAKAGTIFVRDARVAVSYNAVFWIRWINIVVEVVVLSFISSLVHPSARFGYDARAIPYFSYVAVNMAFVRFQTTALLSFAEAIRDGQVSGAFEAILATPTSLTTIVLSAGLWGFALTTAQTAVFLGVAAMLGLDLSHVNVALALLFIVLTVAAVSPLGVLASALTMTFKKTGPIEVLMQSSAVLLGGVYLPVDRLPAGLQVVSWCLPITHALRGIRAAFQGAPYTYVVGDAVWLALATGVLLPVSLIAFTRAVHRAKIDGSLAHH